MCLPSPAFRLTKALTFSSTCTAFVDSTKSEPCLDRCTVYAQRSVLLLLFQDVWSLRRIWFGWIKDLLCFYLHGFVQSTTVTSVVLEQYFCRARCCVHGGAHGWAYSYTQQWWDCLDNVRRSKVRCYAPCKCMFSVYEIELYIRYRE